MKNAVRWLAELTAIPSVTGTDGELHAVEWLERALRIHGITADRAGLPERPNLIARLPGTHPGLKPLVLLSHIDVVPADEAAWSQPPFGGMISGGRLYGRGTLDTKQLTVMELLAFLNLHAAGNNRRDVYLMATVDEEKGSEAGAGLLAKQRPELFDGVIAISEGGGFPLTVDGKPYLTLTVGEKANCRIRLTAEGQAGHAAAPGQEQAVVQLARALAKVLEGVDRLEPVGPVREAMTDLLGPAPDHRLAAELTDYAGRCGVSTPPFRIGEKVNVLPSDASVTLELRPLPGTTQAQVEGWLHGWLHGEKVQWTIERFQPGVLCPPEEEPARTVIALAEQSAAARGYPARVLAMLALGRTDGRFFGQNSAVFGFSPLGPEDAFDRILPMVHGNDESVSLAGFEFGCGVFCDLITRLATEVED